MKTTLVLFLAIGGTAFVQGFANIPRNPNLAFMEDLKSRGDSRIISGYPAVNGQFPHQAFLLIHQNSGGLVGCGGSLIASHLVLTAAHCVEIADEVQVHLGDVKYPDSPVVISSTDFIIHEEYDDFNLNHDIALIKLPSDVEETQNIKIIPYAHDPTMSYVNYQGTVSGFGAIEDGGLLQVTLNYVGVKVIPNADCAEVYGSEVIIDSTLCAIGAERPEQGTCGDNGSPLVVKHIGIDVLIGVVSFGHRMGCTSEFPNGFTRTSHYAKWISDNTN